MGRVTWVRVWFIVAIVLMAAGAGAQTIAGVVRDDTGAVHAGRDRRGRQPGAHRESPRGDH